jgi:DNA-binding response OmpR family regulator
MLTFLLFTQDETLIQKINRLHSFLTCHIQVARTRKEGISYICNRQVTLCAIDMENDGEGFCTALKLINESLPTVVFSVDDSEKTKLRAFEKGCDDYILKSVSPKEIQFRLQSVLKRTLNSNHSVSESEILINEPIVIGNSTIDFTKRNFHTPYEMIPMSKKETSLLKLFYTNRGKLLRREDILKEIWNTSDYYASKSMDVYLSKLRKILVNEEAVSIQNIHGKGYMFVEQSK